MTISEQQKIFRDRLGIIYEEGEARTITSMIFEKELGLSSTRLSLERFQVITTDQSDRLNKALERLLTHEPVQYVLGEADFCGLKFEVNSGVLIPRQETEELVYWIIEEISNQRSENRYQTTDNKPLATEFMILDIGTGSGCIAISLASKLPGAMVEACDISPEALQVSSDNNRRLGTNVRFFPKDILTEGLAENHYDLIVSNPPYISVSEKETMSQNVLSFEPYIALFDKDLDALTFYRRIGMEAITSLKSGGFLFMEINENKGAEVEAILTASGFKNVELKTDINGKERMIKACK